VSSASYSCYELTRAMFPAADPSPAVEPFGQEYQRSATIEQGSEAVDILVRLPSKQRWIQLWFGLTGPSILRIFILHVDIWSWHEGIWKHNGSLFEISFCYLSRRHVGFFSLAVALSALVTARNSFERGRTRLSSKHKGLG